MAIERQPNRISLAQEMSESYLEYAMSTIISRALPDARDGLKPVQRRILVVMNDLHLSPNRKHLKCAKVAGQTSGDYHPHGEQNVYPALVRLAQDFSMRYPLVDGQGNFGCFTGDTRIKLLDGTEKPFAELAELGPDEVFYVYSVDEQGRIVVGEGRNARVTRRNARLMELTLDNGETIRCTPDHKFMLRDGTYRAAEDLTENDSLMPGYFDTETDGFNLGHGILSGRAAPLSRPAGDGRQGGVALPVAYNHRVVSKRWLDERADVYDITVDKYHNFLLASGVFVHNSVDGDPPAAMRYTEARMTPLAVEMLVDLEKETVDYRPNYDERIEEPVVLPGKFPCLLCNGNEGIAVGMSTKIPPHNLGEVTAGICAYIDNPDITNEELMEHIPAPDFPTYGLILGTQGIREMYTTGRGSVTMQARAVIEPIESGRTAIIVTELPYQVNKARLQEQIAELVNKRRIEGISALRDESDRNGMRLVIELRRDAIPHVVLNNLYKHTPMRSGFPAILLALVDGAPRLLDLKGLIREFVEHRQEVVTRRTRFELRAAEARAHILEGLLVALDHIDAVIALIRSSANRTEARDRLRKEYQLSEKQAQAIVDMTLGTLTGLERQKIENEYREVQAEIAYLRDLLANPRKILDLIKKEQQELAKKYGDERRTVIRPEEADDIRIQDLIAEEEMAITLTRDGYAKRLPLDTYRVQHRGGKGIVALSKKRT
jgi:DNA gyrase subunit A